MLKEALEVGADIIMLDNMSVEDMIEAVTLCAGKALNKRGYISSEIYYLYSKGVTEILRRLFTVYWEKL